MIVDRYYYSQLNKKEQAIYKAFYTGVMEHKDIIPIPVRGLFNSDQLGKIFKALTLDNPLIYYLNQSACNFATDALGRVAIVPQYFYSAKKVKEFNKKVQDKANQIIADLNLTVGSDYEKELKVHDWLCKNVTYDFHGADKSNLMRVIRSHNIIGVFASKTAQCEGIAKAAKVLLNAVDVKCIVVEGMANDGKSNEPHAWNIVKLGNDPYQVDITWDIGASAKKRDYIAYDYFNVSDTIIGRSHKAELKMPVCNKLDLNYFNLNNMFFKSKRVLFSTVEKTFKNTNEIYFRLDRKIPVEEITEDINKIIYETKLKQGITNFGLMHCPNPDINTIFIRII